MLQAAADLGLVPALAGCASPDDDGDEDEGGDEDGGSDEDGGGDDGVYRQDDSLRAAR
jgi:hypothetical protein